MTVNEIINTACRDLSMIRDDENADGDLLDACVELLNVAIASLNSDAYIASTIREDEVSAAGHVYFRKAVTGETLGADSIDIEPPDNIVGVARKVGIRYLRLTGATPQDLAAAATASLPQLYSYGITSETAPDSSIRMVGVLSLNGTVPVVLKVFSAQAMPKYSAGDTIYLSDLYRNLVLYALEMRMVKRYKLYAYKESVAEDLLEAKDAIDKNAAVNRPLTNLGNAVGSYMDDFCNGMAGVGL